jgi:hypothetical protein
MTASGIASLAITSFQLGDLAPKDATAESAGLESAYTWMSKNYSVAGNPYANARGVVSRWHYYYLAALTGAMFRTQQANLDDRDWRTDTTELLLMQQREDGSWAGEELESNSNLATALALIVLANGGERK